jgi:transposase-like protein
MANIRKTCPYDKAKQLEAAIDEHQGVERLAEHLSVSPNTLRGWARKLGARTTCSNTKPGAKAKENVFSSADEMRSAIEAAGSVAQLADELGVAINTLRKWMRELGAQADKNKRAELLIDVTTDAEFEALLGCFGAQRLANLIDVSERTVRDRAFDRGIQVRSTQSPKMSMLSRRIKELEQQDASLQELRQTIADAAEMVATEPPPRLPAVKPRKDRRACDVILHVSDKQYGMLVNPDEVPGGGYSPELYEERLERYILAIDALLENTANANPIGTLWIAQGGDFVEGDDVFKGHTWHLAIDAGEQCVRLGRIWAAAVARISQRARQVGAKRIAVVSVVGNHGVKGGRSAGAVPPSLNYDFLTYELVRSQLEGMGGIVDYYDTEARSAVYFDTCGGIVLLTHGEQDKGGGLIGVPVVTGMRNSLTAMVSTGVRPVLHLSGHFHRPAQISLSSDLMRIWSGPWVGQTNLSIGRGGASSPSQHMLVMHPEHGMIAQHVIRLTGATESAVEVVRL